LDLVTTITSFGRSGLSDFLLQRASAVVLGLYALCVVSWLLLNPQASYEELGWYFGSLPMRLFSTLALFSLLAHAWIGMWTVGTDYIRKLMFGKYATILRLTYQMVVSLILASYIIWGLAIVWGVL
jgi:succinate dehydrogenase / fumarate reductase membrane anchor subunit